MQQAYAYIKSALQANHSNAEITAIAALLLSEITGLSNTALIINKNTKISDIQRMQLESFVNQLLQGIPVQYLIGKTTFYGLDLAVNNQVLIPRPETEELVEWIKNTTSNRSDTSILDLGTGSGCIAIAIKQLLSNCNIAACDISESALDIARANARRHNLAIHFFKHNILEHTHFDGNFDVIVSNPPYIPLSEATNMQSQVVGHEPHVALFVPDNDPLVFYKAIIRIAQRNLKSNGRLFFEVHFKYGRAVELLLLESGFSRVELRADISGNDRMIMAAL